MNPSPKINRWTAEELLPNMRAYTAIAFLFCLLLSCGEKDSSRILVFAKTNSPASLKSTGLESIIDQGKKSNFNIDTTTDARHFNERNLKRYAAVVFLNTTPNDLDHYEQADLERFRQAGGEQIVTSSADVNAAIQQLATVTTTHVALDYKKATTKHVPEENRFTKVVLKYNFDEPTEMAILPDNRILFLERKGAVKLYDPTDDSLRTINTFNVWTKFEDGMLGLTLDPDFAKNNWLYIFYSSPNKSANVLSRFVFTKDKIDMSSEKQLLEVPTQRETCCHTGGSLAFAPDGNLFLSTGDNTSPFESDGYSPADERRGRAPFDAQKSSSNTNDLRGKILRIHPQGDGTYTIPEGNLFPKGEPKTRPEIYVMGCRNPYRISVDQKTGYLYWGEVGPDAGQNDSIRGPRGYDEVNQAQKPGYYGWPYFVGNNFAYGEHNFATNKTGARHDPLKPVNNSPNTTGKLELPPATPPIIWYPYAHSDEFPMLKEGGRNAMAGPIYYSENYTGKTSAYPDYFDGKVIIYDWMRNWIFLVTLDGQGRIQKMEPFIPHTSFNNIIDMAFGPDGKLYTLEYGSTWFKQNKDARLSRIDYNGGNRVPYLALSADKEAGAVPLNVKFSGKGTYDPDGDHIQYELSWDGKKEKSEDGEFTVTFEKPGVYTPKLTVTDDSGNTSAAEITIIAGNDPPKVSIELEGNSMFFFPNTTKKYAVEMNDREDGSTKDGKISDVQVTFDYLPQGYDITAIAQGHQKPALPGKAMIAASDCKACHLMDSKSAGPSYRDVGKRYKGDLKAVEKLTDKVMKGGSGVWGETQMSAHPQLTSEQVSQMVEYILSLGEEGTEKILPPQGTVTTSKEIEGAYILSASYKDKGANGNIPSLEASQTIVLRKATLTSNDVNVLHGPKKGGSNSMAIVNIRHNSSIVYKNIDLTDVGKIELVIAKKEQQAGGTIAVYLDSPEGQLLGKVDFSKGTIVNISDGLTTMRSSITLTNTVRNRHNLYLLFINEKADNKDLFRFAQLNFEKTTN